MQAQQAEWWLSEVEATVARLVGEGADAKKQQEAIDKIAEEFGEEAAAIAARQFAEARWEVRKEKEEKVEWKAEGLEDVTGLPLLSKAGPWDNADEFWRRYKFEEGVCTLRFWADEFWEWNGCCYEKVSEKQINKEIWIFLNSARTGIERRRFRPKPADVEGVTKALKAQVLMNVVPPCWLDDGSGNQQEGAEHLLAFKNGLVDIRNGKLLALTPRLWTTAGLDFDYDPQAQCPVWERFLGEVFEGDPESSACIEEQLGYGMTAETKFHKGFLWIGPKGREGKGTLAHILSFLVGSTAYVALDFSDWLKNDYSAQALLGCKVGCFPDIRLQKGKFWGQNWDAGGIEHKSKGMLLRICGGDDVTIYRKYDPVPWKGVLPTKMFLLSNEIPNFNDANLPTRFIKIAFRVSFRDREDLEMLNKLKAELPGIANRCLSAYRRLRERGKFIQPVSGLKLARDLAAKSNPYQAFLDDVCVFDPGGWVECVVLYGKFLDWCLKKGRLDLLQTVKQSSHLSRELNKQVPEFEALQIYRPNGEQRKYLGIRLKTKAELEGFKATEVKSAQVVPIARAFLRRA